MLLNLGFNNYVNKNRVVAIVDLDSTPIRRLIGEAKESGCLIDVTMGRRTRSVVVLDSNHVVLSAVSPETLALRWTAEGASEE